MNRRLLRLVIGFLAGFVLLSLLPMLPEALRSLERLPDPDQLGDILLAVTAGLCLVLLVVLVGRRRAATRQVHPFRQALARHAAAPVPAPAAVARRPGTVAAGAAAAPQSALEARIRTAAHKGERVPALARRHGVSIDAIRTALGEPRSAPAASRGSSFRPRQQSLPAAPPARAISVRKTPYGALA